MDDMGRAVNVPDFPSRIVALTPSLTETLFALGCGSRLVGTVDLADYPAEARLLPNVGSYVSPNLEKIASLKPDLVFADKVGNPPQVVKMLEMAGQPVYVLDARDPLTLPEKLENLARICGESGTGVVLADRMRTKMEALIREVATKKPVRTLLVIGHNPLVSAGGETLQGKLLALLKADNLAAAAPGDWPRLSLEYVVQAQPEVIILTHMEVNADLRRQIEYWRNLPGLSQRPGLRVESIHSDLINRPGPRIVSGMEKLARILHPDSPAEED